MTHLEEVHAVFYRACTILKLRGFYFRPMTSRSAGARDIKKSYRLGHTNLKTKTVTVDIYTAKQRKSKKISAILSVIAHELTHHQKPPFRQRFRGRWINRIHFPAFYRQVNRNVAKFKKDAVLEKYFSVDH